MEGNSFGYTYDADIILTDLDTAQGPWQYRTQLPYRDTNWEQMYVTITDPEKRSERFGWDGLINDDRNIMWHEDQKKNRSFWLVGDVIDGKGVITRGWVADPADATRQIAHTIGYDPATGLPSGTTDNTGRTVSTTRNALGMVTSVKDAQNQTTRFQYAPNGIDLLSVVDVSNRTVASFAYNNRHQPVRVTDIEGKSSTMDYTPWGAVAWVKGPDNHLTTYTYNAAKQLQSVSYDGQVMGSYTYDSVGRVNTSTDTSNITLAYQYNDLDKLTKVTYPDGTYSAIEYACCGLPGMVRDRSGRMTFYDYDELQRLSRVQDPSGQSVFVEYDANGNKRKIQDSRGNSTTFTYDSLNRPTKKTYADGTWEQIGYDTPNNSVWKRDAQGRVTRSYFSDNGNLERVDYPSQPDVTIEYDTLNRPWRITDGTGLTQLGYDSRGNVDEIDGPWANDTLSYHFDDEGRRDWMRINGTDQTSYLYDDLGRLDGLSTPVGAFDPVYSDSTSLLRAFVLPNGTRADYGYDGQGRLNGVANTRQNTTLGGANISQYGYGFHPTGQQSGGDLRAFEQRQIGADPVQQVNYGYDAISQLKSEVSSEVSPAGVPAPLIRNLFDWDAMGNRKSSQHGVLAQGGAAATYTANRLNQYDSITSSRLDPQTQQVLNSALELSYDAVGNLRGTRLSSQDEDSGTRYTYDEANRLSAIEVRDAAGVPQHKSAFVYDFLSRKKIAREFTWNAGASTWTPAGEKRYVYDGMGVVQERDGQNRVTSQYVRAGNIGGLLAKTAFATSSTGAATSSTFFYHYDGSGNVAQLTDTLGATVAAYSYDAFGNTLSATGNQASANLYRYQTKELHASSGLYDFGFRFYSPGLGRWLNRDPLREDGGLHLYAAFANNPLAFADPYGLSNCGRLALGMLGGMLGSFGGLPGTAIGTGIGSALGSLFDGKGLDEAVMWGAMDGGAALVGGWVIGKAAGAIGSRFGAGAADEALTVADDIVRAADDGAANQVEKIACFVAGTPVVMADGSLKPIEKVRAGEKVLSRDEKSGKTQAKKVKRTFENHKATLVLTLAGGEKIETTAEHPFYVQGKGFVKAGELGIGTSIVTRAGPAPQVLAKESKDEVVPVFNFEVEGFHTYFVGTAQVWVHNDCSPEIALGKFNRLQGKDFVPELAPFTERLSESLGKRITNFDDWKPSDFGLPKSDSTGGGNMILAAMENAQTIHFNTRGVNFDVARSGGGAYRSAEWELHHIIQNGWLGKTKFYFWQ
jgi:RHS repeat-associated protein